VVLADDGSCELVRRVAGEGGRMTKGPIYGVELIDTLPLGKGGMLQQMPSRDDLERSRRNGDRVAAGYEVLLAHWREALKRIEVLSETLTIAEKALRRDAKGDV
jgi:hypothetical protein